MLVYKHSPLAPFDDCGGLMKCSSVASVWSSVLAVTLAWLLLGIPHTVSATGFFINQQSVRGLGRANAGSAVAADELGTMFFNPAGLTRVMCENDDCIRITLGTHLIVPRSDQRSRASLAATPGSLGSFVPVGGGDANNPTGPTPVPNLYAAVGFMDQRAAVGVAVNSPFGLTTSFDADWHGRYDATDASLRTFNVSIVGAYRVNTQVSVGGGVDFQAARSLLSSAIPNPLAPAGPTAATDAWMQTKGHDWLTPGFNVGVLYELTDAARLGVHYRSGMSHEVEGATEIHGLQGPLAAFNGRVDAGAELHLPSVLTTGVRAPLGDRLVMLGEFQWFDWSTFEEVRIRFADGRPDAVRPTRYQDAYAVALGAEYPVNAEWIARGGLRFDTTPTVDGYRDTTVPDSARLWLGGGTSVRLSERVRMDFAFTHVFFRETTIDLTRTFFDETPLASVATIHSDVSSTVNTLAIDLRVRF
jgi:long-chain fatty acid transport protein